MIFSKRKFVFPKSNRLRTQKDFEDFFNHSRSRTLGSIKLFYHINTAVHQPRLGISVSSKFFNAVERNSLKRLIREYFRTSKNLFFRMDVVISVRYSKELVFPWKSFLKIVKQDLNNLVTSISNQG